MYGIVKKLVGCYKTNQSKNIAAWRYNVISNSLHVGVFKHLGDVVWTMWNCIRRTKLNFKKIYM